MRSRDRRTGPRIGRRRTGPRTGPFRTVRFKVVLLVLVSLISLSVLWAFSAWVTLGEGLNLRKVKAIQEHYEYPSGAVGGALQIERRLTLVYLGSGSASDRAAMESGRLVTDRQAALFRDLSGHKEARDAAPAQTRRLADEVVAGLNNLAGRRATVDDGRTIRSQAFADYTALIARIGTLQGSLSTLSNPEVARDARNQVALARAREALAQEDALITGALATGRMSRTEHAEFIKLVGTQRSLFALAEPELRPEDRSYLLRIVNSPEFGRLRSLEDRFVQMTRLPKASPTDETAGLWRVTADSSLTRLRGVELALGEASERRAQPIADGIITRLILAGALGLVAVLVSIVLAIWSARSIIRDLNELKREALDLADTRLPRVIQRLRRGEEVDVLAEVPPLAFGTREIDQVGQAFNAARRTAIAGAVDEAALRRGISEVFVNLARRSQTLLHRQLGLLDEMERRISEPDDLEDLFRVDHLATRMRRHAEGLIILSGQAPGRGWRNPVAVIDVARAAASEVEDYTRVTVAPMPQAAVTGMAVADLIHLLAELIENATSFSPPHTTVQVTGQLVARGFTIEIEDRGLSMDGPSLAEANARLADPPEFDLTNSDRLGLFVVGRLAQRHGVQVTLRTSPFGGMSAIVLLPESLVVRGDADDLISPRRSQETLIHAGASGEHASPAPGASVVRLPEPGPRYQQSSETPWRPAPPEPPAPRSDPGPFDPPSGQDNSVPENISWERPAPAEEDPAMDPALPPVPTPPPTFATDAPRTGPPSSGEYPLPPTGALPETPQPDEPDEAVPPPVSGSGLVFPEGEPKDTETEPADEWVPHPGAQRTGAQEPAPEGGIVFPGEALPASQPAPEPAPEAAPAARKERPALPKRVRQANLAPQLHREEREKRAAREVPLGAPTEADGARPGRSPEELRRMMSSIQQGTRRGRSEAAASADEET